MKDLKTNTLNEFHRLVQGLVETQKKETKRMVLYIAEMFSEQETDEISIEDVMVKVQNNYSDVIIVTSECYKNLDKFFIEATQRWKKNPKRFGE